jgi:hypothetical protein
MSATAPAVPVVVGSAFVAASFLNDDLSIRDYFFNVGYTTALFGADPSNINLGEPTVVDAFNAATLTNLNYGVNAQVNTFLGLQATAAGVPQAYVAGSNPLSSLTLFVRDQAQPAYTASPVTPLAPTPPATGIAVSGAGPNPPAFTFTSYALTTSEATICAGTNSLLPCAAAAKTSTVFTATANGTTGSFNNPFSRVDFYAVNVASNTLVFLGSVSAPGLTDNGANRAWTYSFPITASALLAKLGGSAAQVIRNVYALGVSRQATWPSCRAGGPDRQPVSSASFGTAGRKGPTAGRPQLRVGLRVLGAVLSAPCSDTLHFTLALCALNYIASSPAPPPDRLRIPASPSPRT